MLFSDEGRLLLDFVKEQKSERNEMRARDATGAGRKPSSTIRLCARKPMPLQALVVAPKASSS